MKREKLRGQLQLWAVSNHRAREDRIEITLQMRKAKPQERKGLAGPQSQLVTPSPAAFHSTSPSDRLPEQEEETRGKVTTEKDTPRRLASSSQGEDRREAGLLDEEVPGTPTRTHMHTCPFSRVQAGAIRVCVCVCVCVLNTSMHTCKSTHGYVDTLSLESRLVP